MKLKGIIAVSGMGGLFKLVSQTKSGFIVESLADSKRSVVPASSRISSLEDISVYTTGEDVPLKKVLSSFREQGSVPEAKADPASLRSFLKQVVPDYDEKRVYDSDVKKMFTWFSLLKDKEEYWGAEDTADSAVPGIDDIKGPALPQGDKPHTHLTKEAGRVNTHGLSSARSVIPQKRGGG